MALSSFLLDTHPFSFAIKTDIPQVADSIEMLYGDVLRDDSTLTLPTYDVEIKHASLLRRLLKPQTQFFCDQREPFLPMPSDKSLAMFEWGLNWIVSAHEFRHVILHSAVLAKNNKAILFPAPPGSGKSTLTSWLSHNGWRLLSDEMALMTPNTTEVTPFVRPICLKNNAINLANSWFPSGRFSHISPNTHKGDVVHLSPPTASWDARREKAEVVAIVYPQYSADTYCDIYELSKAEAFSTLTTNAFNYGVLGGLGFSTLTNLVEKSKTFEVRYNNLEELQSFLENDVLS
ncbi:HprK-related kinase A [Alteromonas sp. McT4-15]|uniref:HprK-related kinase A n=1 Tax=Alteromonas sp. McT4-15 TaxID=2881256 RepID=UPI001CF8D77A|nr:HprK-related kinase A [Alteromonas sp. McT4-15]MCB4436276.1 HprK-related kinase A [Alteromonas sp. McT4-15]